MAKNQYNFCMQPATRDAMGDRAQDIVAFLAEEVEKNNIKPNAYITFGIFGENYVAHMISADTIIVLWEREDPELYTNVVSGMIKEAVSNPSSVVKGFGK